MDSVDLWSEDILTATGKAPHVHGTGMDDQILNASRLVVVGCVRVVAPDPVIRASTSSHLF
jgi:hypothetical protein